MKPARDHDTAREAALLAARIQSTLVSNCVTRELWEKHVADCVRYRFHAAMVPAAWVRASAQKLRGTRIRVAAWIDMP